MTEAQQQWEAWYQAFQQLREAWPADIDVPCPNTDHGRVPDLLHR